MDHSLSRPLFILLVHLKTSRVPCWRLPSSLLSTGLPSGHHVLSWGASSAPTPSLLTSWGPGTRPWLKDFMKNVMMTAKGGHCSVRAQMDCSFRVGDLPCFTTSPVNVCEYKIDRRPLPCGNYCLSCIGTLCYEGKCCGKPMLVNTSQDLCSFTNLVTVIASFSCKGSAGTDKGSIPDPWVYFVHQANSYV